jgi:hypothetical protein
MRSVPYIYAIAACRPARVKYTSIYAPSVRTEVGRSSVRVLI